MSADVKGVYILRNPQGVPNKACINEGYALGTMLDGDTIEYHALLTPEQAAVIAAAKAWADNEDVRGAKLYDAVATLRKQEGA